MRKPLQTIAILVVFPVLLAPLCGCQLRKTRELQNRVAMHEHIQTARNKITVFTETSTADDVIAWWDSAWFKGRALGLMRMEHTLQHMQAARLKKGYETYTLYKAGDVAIVLDVPTETWGDGTMPKCYDNKSMLRVSGLAGKHAIDLNPYCSESYDLTEVDIQLFVLPPSKMPLIEIVTNGPACVPAILHGFNPATGSYEKKAAQCGG